MSKIIEFKLPDGKVINLKYIKNNRKGFVARSPSIPLGRIKVDSLFFKFTHGEQVSIIYHELWHYRKNFVFDIKYRMKKPWLLLLPGNIKKIMHQQEFEADLNALKMTNKKDTLSMLKRLKKMIEKGVIPRSHEKTHPLIDERIKRVKEY